MLLPLLAFAGADLRELDLRQQYGPRLHWDNISDSPAWVSGVAPAYRYSLHLHTISLLPGETSRVQISAASQLRIHSTDVDSDLTKLRYEISNGSGLYISSRPLIQQAGDVLLDINRQSPCLVQITNPANTGEAFEFALYRSRLQLPPELKPYRDLISIDKKPQRLRQQGLPSADKVWPLAAGEQQLITVHGPARYRLEHRARLFANPEPGSNYQLSTGIEGQWHKTSEYSLSAETHRLLLVDDTATRLSRQQRTFLQVPAGVHALHLSTNQDILFRLIKSSETDYLLPGLNQTGAEISPDRDIEAWRLTQQQALQTLLQTDSLQGLQEAALRLSMDNRRLGGGLLAASAMRHQARLRPDLPELSDLAEQLLQKHSYLDALQPNNAASKSRFQPYSYPRLREPRDQRDRLFMPQADLALYTDQQAQAFFSSLGGNEALQYSLPERHADSLLRVVIVPAAEQQTMPSDITLEITLDQQAPVSLRLIRDEGLDAWRYEVTPAIALAALNGATNRQSQRSQMTMASIVELPLSEAVTHIELRRTDTLAAPIMLALQYRASRPYQLSENSYLSLSAELHGGQTLLPLFNSCLLHLDDILDADNEALESILEELPLAIEQGPRASALLNHWLPLFRWLRLRRDFYQADINLSDMPAPASAERFDPQQTYQSAQQAEQQQQWPLALKLWRKIALQGPSKYSLQAITGMTQALSRAGESYLAERVLRRAYLQDSNQEIRRHTLQLLRTQYQQDGNTLALEGLLAFELLRKPGPETITSLYNYLFQAGRYADAVSISQLLPQHGLDAEQLLLTALKAHWWTVFERAFETLETEDRRLFWSGLRGLEMGDYAQATASWKQGSGAANELLQQLQEGLGQSTATDRQSVDIAAWRARLPGPRIWRLAPELVDAHQGMETVNADALGLSFDAYRASPEQALSLSVSGPARLRFDVMPVHTSGQETEAYDGWFTILNAQGRQWATPLSNNRPSLTLRLNETRQRIGRLEQRELIVPAGVHHLRLNISDREALVRVFRESPVLFDADIFQHENMSPPGTLTGRSLIAATHCQDLSETYFISCSAAVQKPSLPATEVSPATTHTDPVKERSSSADWLAYRPEKLPLMAFIAEQAEPLAAVTENTLPEQQLTALLWLLEKHPVAAEEILPRMHSLLHQQDNRSLLAGILQRADRGSHWQQITYVPESAGLRFVDLTTPEAESPSIAMHATLMSGPCAGMRLLSGANEIVYAMYNTERRRLEIELVNCELYFQPPQPLRIEIDEGEGGYRPVDLRPRGRLTRQIHFPAGERALRMRISKPMVNQYLGFRIRDPEAPEMDRLRRAYQVATSREPVRFDVHGPAWLRIDELRDGQTQSRYMAIKDGWQLLELKPANGQPEALFRIFERQRPEGTIEIARARPRNFILRPMPGPSLPLASLAGAQKAIQHTALNLKDQYDGSISGGLKLVSRTRADDEEDDASIGQRLRENFAEFKGQYRFFDADLKRYWRSEAFIREREQGSPSLGISSHVYTWPFQQWPDLQLSAHLGGIFQHPGQTLATGNSGNEWIVNARAQASLFIPLGLKAQHTPSLTVFGRLMSMDRNQDYQNEALDRDVFSRYKAQHKTGLGLADSFSYSPWLDTEWYGRIAVNSNEDFNLLRPDNIDSRIGWQQLIGDAELDASYRRQRFMQDDDRSKGQNRRALEVKINWTSWLSSRQRMQLGLQINHDIDRDENSFVFSLQLHASRAQTYRDFRRSEVAFKDRRERDAAAASMSRNSP